MHWSHGRGTTGVRAELRGKEAAGRVFKVRGRKLMHGQRLQFCGTLGCPAVPLAVALAFYPSHNQIYIYFVCLCCVFVLCSVSFCQHSDPENE